MHAHVFTQHVAGCVADMAHCGASVISHTLEAVVFSCFLTAVGLTAQETHATAC